MSVNKLILVLSVIAFIGDTQSLLNETTLKLLMMQFKQTCTDRNGSDEGYRQLLASIDDDDDDDGPTSYPYKANKNELVTVADMNSLYSLQLLHSDINVKKLRHTPLCLPFCPRQIFTSILAIKIEPAKTCFQKHLNEQQLKADFKLVYFSMTRKQFYNKYCPQLKESLSCLHELFEGVAKYVGNDRSQAMKDKAYNYVDLLCHDYGQMLYEVLQKKFQGVSQ